MHIEIRELKNGTKKYYLAHSFRDGDGRVRKMRKYLGADLKKEEIERLRKGAERELEEKIAAHRKIRDPFQTALSQEELQEINKLIEKNKEDLKLVHLTSEEDWKRFTEVFTYNTNAIEGSTVQLSEVGAIIEKDEWPENRTKEEISETYGGAEALKYVRKTGEHLSLKMMGELHRIIFRNSKTFAGDFRAKGVEVVVMGAGGIVIHRGAPQQYVVSLLKELIKWYEDTRGKYHPLVLAAVVHNQFENIHPFQDGNGRIGRLLLNNVLLKNGLPPVNISLQDRGEYYRALEEYQNEGNIRPTIELLLKEYRRMGREAAR